MPAAKAGLIRSRFKELPVEVQARMDVAFADRSGVVQLRRRRSAPGACLTETHYYRSRWPWSGAGGRRRRLLSWLAALAGGRRPAGGSRRPLVRPSRAAVARAAAAAPQAASTRLRRHGITRRRRRRRLAQRARRAALQRRPRASPGTSAWRVDGGEWRQSTQGACRGAGGPRQRRRARRRGARRRRRPRCPATRCASTPRRPRSATSP